MKTRRCPLRYRGLPVAGVWRQLGRAGAGLALAIQLLLPFIVVGPHASSIPAVLTASVLAQAAAFWGRDAICTLGAVTKHDGNQRPLADHKCPICWALQRTASLLPPSAGIPLSPPAPTRIEAPSATIEACAEAAYSPAQPRGPPFV